MRSTATRASSRRRSIRSSNEPRVVHLQGHGDRHAEQRHALFDLLDGPARRADRALACRPWTKRYYSVQLCDGNTYNYGYIGSRATGSEAGDYWSWGPDWKGETPAGIKKVFRSSTQFSLRIYRTQLFDPARHGQRDQGPGRLQGAAALGLSEAARAAASPGHRFPEDRQASSPRRTSSNISTSRCSSRLLSQNEAESAPSSHDRHRARQDLRLQGSAARAEAAEIALGMKDGERKIDAAVADGGEERQRLARWRVLRRQRLLQRRLAQARRAAKAGIYGNDADRGDVSHSPAPTATARRSTAASTTTRSPSPPASCRRSTPSGR